MARNKYPEETVQLILDVAEKLFMEKGYDHTTIQDIVDQMGGLTKGALYHHFKSKEEIFLAVNKRFWSKNRSFMPALEGIITNPELNEKEKLKSITKAMTYQNPWNELLYHYAPDFRKTPQFMIESLEYSYGYDAHTFIQPILEEGVKKGTIDTQYPRELAEVLMVLSNFWLFPSIHPGTQEECERRIRFYVELAEKFGLSDVVDDEMIQQYSFIAKLYENMHKEDEEKE